MQVNDYHRLARTFHWISLRMYDSLEHGEEYINAKPGNSHRHPSIIRLFQNIPCLYSKNQIMDVNTYRIYSDKFSPMCWDLSQIDLATEETASGRLMNGQSF